MVLYRVQTAARSCRVSSAALSHNFSGHPPRVQHLSSVRHCCKMHGPNFHGTICVGAIVPPCVLPHGRVVALSCSAVVEAESKARRREPFPPSRQTRESRGASVKIGLALRASDVTFGAAQHT